MLDFELAEIYGYTTTRFNEQVKNNIEKFDDDFMFELTKEEFENLMSKKSTSSWGGRRKRSKAFTEQGIYMLMTVLRGELAIKQSKALIRTFKKMKSFVDEEDNGWLMFNTKYCTADLAYSEIYGQAKKSIFVVDNYIGLRTLVLLKNAPAGVSITLFSDNVGGRLHRIEYADFCKEYSSIQMTLRRTGGICHDRFIVLDYNTEEERVFLCGASSKDVGARVTSIVEDYGTEKYKLLIETLLKNQELILT